MRLPPPGSDPIAAKEFWVRALLSVAAIFYACFVMSSPHFDPGTKSWAQTIGGAIMGYWFKK
jgi:hypothetical protein